MISATALNASTVPLNKSPQMPLGLDNSRLRVDSQKFLVPSLPVSSRQINPRPDPHNNHHPHHHPHNPHSLHYQQQQQQHHNGSASSEGINKRRPIHPISPVESGRSGMSAVHNLNGLHRRSTSPLSGKGASSNYAHMQSSPRKDAHSPMYAGEVPGFSGSPGSNFSPQRSSVPIPCSSPSPGTSASPKSSGSHSLSPSSGSSTSYPPHLPPGLNQSTNGASELSQLAVAAAAAAAASGNRLYPAGFPPPSAAAAHHAAFYAAAAAAAGHSLPYPSLFGSHYSPHQHPAAAANSYLDFHSKLLRNSAAAAAVASAELRSPSQSPPSRSYQAAVSPQQQQSHNILQPLGSPQSTSVTSLHTKLIESVSATGDRFHPHHHASHNHNHAHSSGPSNQQPAHTNRFSSSSSSSNNNGTSNVRDVSKGGPLGISGGIMGLSISPNSSSPHKGHSGPAATSATPEMSSKSVKLYMEHPGIPRESSSRENSVNQQERKLLAEMELLNGSKAAKEAIMLAKQRMMTRSPEDYSTTGRHHHSHHHSQHQEQLQQQHQQQQQPTQKIAKSISFASDIHPGGHHHRPPPPTHPSYMNGHASHHHHHHPQQHHLHSQHSQSHHHHQQHSSSSSSGGATNLSPDCKKSNGSAAGSHSSSNNSVHPVNSSFHHQQQQHHLFLPPSPKKRSAHWNFAVPQSPLNSNGGGGKVGDLLPPPPPPSSVDSLSESSTPTNLHLSPSSKYLSPNQHNQKPSNGGPAAPVGMTGVSSGGGGANVAAATGSHYQSTNAQQLLVVPNSPLSSSSSSHGGSGPSTPKSPSVHFRFFGGGANNKENNGVATNATGRNGRILNARNDSSSSTSSVELGVINGNTRSRQNNNNGHVGPWPVEQMPVISAFRKGSMIKLASGELKAVEELNEDDFEKAVMMTDSVRIVYCHVLAIQAIADSSMCKVTLAMGSAHNQQVVVESSPEQPFFIRGKGWSSSAPKLTEKLLQLPCTTLAVGDICITLTRHNVRNQRNSTSSGGPTAASSSGRGSKSKSGTTRPYGTYSKSRNASTSSILKSSHQARGNNAGGGTRTHARSKLVSGPASTVTAAVNLDVNNSSNCAGNFGINSNSANPISRQSEKISSSAVVPPSPSAKEKVERQQEKSVVQEEKEVDLSLAKANPSTTAPMTKSTTTTNPNPSSSIMKASLCPENSKSDSKELPSLSTAAGYPTTTCTTTGSSYKRKSISPGPLGTSQRNKDDDEQNDEAMRPPSPKKRRWSAPEQMDAESQQNSESSSVSSSKDKIEGKAVNSTNNTSVTMNEKTRGESESKSASKSNLSINENSKDSFSSDDPKFVSITSEVKSPDIPPEKA